MAKPNGSRQRQTNKQQTTTNNKPLTPCCLFLRCCRVAIPLISVIFRHRRPTRLEFRLRSPQPVSRARHRARCRPRARPTDLLRCQMRCRPSDRPARLLRKALRALLQRSHLVVLARRHLRAPTQNRPGCRHQSQPTSRAASPRPHRLHHPPLARRRTLLRCQHRHQLLRQPPPRRWSPSFHRASDRR